VLALWVGITVSYLVSDLPPSFAIMTTAASLYITAFVISILRSGAVDRRRSNSRGTPHLVSRR